MDQEADQWCNKGSNFNTEKKYEEALKAYEQAISIAPNFGRGYYGMGINLSALNRDAEAVESYKKAIAVGRDDAATHENLGIVLRNCGRYEEALQEYGKALEKEPNKATIFKNKGNALMMWGKLPEALESYYKNIELNPKSYDVYADIGSLLELQGKDEEAMKYYNTALSLSPQIFRVNYCKGCLLLRQKKYEEAIKELEVCLKINTIHPGAHFHIGNAYMGMGKKDEAMKYYSKADQMKPEFSIQYCNRGQCYYAIGQKEKALEDFRKTKEFLEKGDNKTMLLPNYINQMKHTIKTVLEAEEVTKQTDVEIKKLDQQNPVVQKFLANIKKLKDKQEEIQVKVVNNLSDNETQQAKNNVQELEKVKDEFKKELVEMQKEIGQLKAQVNVIDNKVTQMQQNIEEMKEELDSKMDDYNKKLDQALDKQDLTPEDKEKLKGYFKAFVGTFASVHVTSQVIDSGQVQLDSGTRTATILSFIASFTPFIGSGLSGGIKSVGDFLKSQEMIKNARKMKVLAHDSVTISQLIGKTGYEILIDVKAQKKIINTTDEDLNEISGNLFQKVVQFCEKLNDKIDLYLYTELYKTPAERVGHNDANALVEKWLKGTITPYGVEKQFITQILKEKHGEIEVKSPNSEAPNETAKGRSACCNLF